MTSTAPKSRLVHVVRIRHAVTGSTIEGARIELLADAWKGWRIDTKNGHQILMRREGFEDTPTGESEGAASGEPASRPWYSNEKLFENAPVSARVKVHFLETTVQNWFSTKSLKEVHVLSAEPQSSGIRQSEIALVPAPMQLFLQLVDEDDQPLVNKGVEARGTGKATISLTEVVDEPGAYISERATWDERYYPFAVVVEGKTAAYRRMDYFKPVTRFRLVRPKSPGG